MLRPLDRLAKTFLGRTRSCVPQCLDSQRLKLVEMSAFSEAALEKKLSELSNSQQSVQTLSLWLIHHRKHSKTIVGVWFNELKKGKSGVVPRTEPGSAGQKFIQGSRTVLAPAKANFSPGFRCSTCSEFCKESG